MAQALRIATGAPEPRIDLTDLEGGATDGFIDVLKLWLNKQARNGDVRDYMELRADVTGALDIPVKPEPFRWEHPTRDRDCTVTLDLYELVRVGNRLIAFYMVEVDCG